MMPLLEELVCEDNYLALYENKDKRIIWDNNQYLYIASAMLMSISIRKHIK